MSRIILALGAMAALMIGASFTDAKAQERDWDYKRMNEGLADFFGGLRGHYIIAYPPLVKDEVLEGIVGPPIVPVDLPGGLQLVSGCRAHSCEDEKAAFVVAPGYKVLAAGMINSHCYWIKPPHKTRKGSLNGPSECGDQTVLTVFLRRSSQSDMLNGILEEWARESYPKPLPEETVWLK